jgi:hypothetical protein
MQQAFSALLSRYPIVAQECATRGIKINLAHLISEAEENLRNQMAEDREISCITDTNQGFVVQLSEYEIMCAFALGSLRTWFNEQVMGWKYRHYGLPSALAHSIGQIGEMAMSNYLKSHEINYDSAPAIVNSKADFRQDFRIEGRSVGLKTAKKAAYVRVLREGYAYYPAKNKTGESRRVLPYPEYLVQMGVDCADFTAHILGVVRGVDISSAETVEMHGKPTHRIPVSLYRPLKHSPSIRAKGN